jgi:predicted oxidoreductase
MDPEEIAEAIFQLQKQGKVREFGVSNFTPSQIALLETAVPVRANQIEFSLTSNGPMYNGTLDDLLANRRLAMAWSPLGVYFREDDQRTQRIKKVLGTLEKKYGANENQLLLAWLLRHPAKISPVVGTANAGRLKDAVHAVEMELELEDWFALLAAEQGHEVP